MTDDQWERLAAVLPPPQRPRSGRPAKDHRTVLNGMRGRLRTGAPWRDRPARDGKWATVDSRFRRWPQAGIWDRVLTALVADGDAAGQVDGSRHVLDGTTMRTHPHAAGAKRGR